MYRGEGLCIGVIESGGKLLLAGGSGLEARRAASGGVAVSGGEEGRDGMAKRAKLAVSGKSQTKSLDIGTHHWALQHVPQE